MKSVQPALIIKHLALNSKFQEQKKKKKIKVGACHYSFTKFYNQLEYQMWGF